MAQKFILNFGTEADEADARVNRLIKAYVASLKQRKNAPTEVTFKRHNPNRSPAQNAYLWAVVYPMAAMGLTEAYGETFDSESAHRFMKGRFLAKLIHDRKTGEVVSTIVPSSTSLDTAEFSGYVDQVVLWCAEYLGVVIPPPAALGDPHKPAATAARKRSA